jgi:cysteine desulfurase / selenocysteine lyase
LSHATSQLEQIPGLKIIGKAREKVSVASFIIDGMHPFDIGMMLDAGGVAVRTGHHCTQPLMNWYGIEGTARASFSVYNTKAEIDRLIVGLEKLVKVKTV